MQTLDLQKNILVLLNKKDGFIFQNTSRISFYLSVYFMTTECQPCRSDWILFQEKCYLFYEEDPWKTWEESRKYCRSKTADLVVINGLKKTKGLVRMSC
uniref:C-type lectin domain-containing protein n=1 Tax=Acanthochromis polyacanthus TaxID=80966 RepID=A0A3Q1ESM8_9TELE